MALYFECRARYDKMQENGMVKKVNEPYIVDALTFTEAENRFIEKVSPYISGRFHGQRRKEDQNLRNILRRKRLRGQMVSRQDKLDNA